MSPIRTCRFAAAGVLLPEKVYRSLQAKPYAQKRDKYLADNLLAGSLHPATYGNNPGFTNWSAREGLPFKAYDDFTVEAIEERRPRLAAEPARAEPRAYSIAARRCCRWVVKGFRRSR
jgi:hypothetical protein